MKRNFKKHASLLMAGMLAVGSMSMVTACGGKKNQAPDNEASIQLSYWKSGLGMAWLENLAAKFEEKYPQYKVYIEETSSVDIFTNTIQLTTDNTIDLYMTTLASSKYNQYFEPISDVLDYQWESEDKTIREKVDPTILKALEAGRDTNYALSYGGGSCSIAYNRKVIDGTKYKVPNTTDELYDLVLKLKTDGLTPFITFEYGGYWFTIQKTWLAQYGGLEYYYETVLKMTNEDGTPNKDLFIDVDKKTGRYQVLQVMEKMMADEYMLTGSSGAKFTAQQTKFIGGKAVMMPNGTWLYNEMENSLNSNDFSIGFMKTPVISAITETLEQVKDDRALSALVAAVDAAETVEDVPLTGNGYSATQYDVDRVWEARHMMFSCIDEQTCVIPNYSNAKVAAKEFLKFMYSDQMIHEYSDIVHMWFPATPTDKPVDTSSWNDWEKDVYKIQKSAIQLTKYVVQSPMVQQCGLFIDPWAYFSARNVKDRLTADQLWAKMQENYEENWERNLYLAGYTK